MMTNEQADALIERLQDEYIAKVIDPLLDEMRELTRAQHQINMAEAERVRKLEAGNQYMKILKEVR